MQRPERSVSHFAGIARVLLSHRSERVGHSTETVEMDEEHSSALRRARRSLRRGEGGVCRASVRAIEIVQSASERRIMCTPQLRGSGGERPRARGSQRAGGRAATPKAG
jgi:hypothetical protein